MLNLIVFVISVLISILNALNFISVPWWLISIPLGWSLVLPVFNFVADLRGRSD